VDHHRIGEGVGEAGELVGQQLRSRDIVAVRRCNQDPPLVVQNAQPVERVAAIDAAEQTRAARLILELIVNVHHQAPSEP
jgi:hypothetical protein